MTDETERMASLVAAHPDYKVLRRLKPRGSFRTAYADTKLFNGAIVDCETTGLEDHDKIIQFAALPFAFDAEGNVYGVDMPYVGMEDPGQPLSEEVQELTGITNEMLAGQKLDDSIVAEVVQHTDLVIAHNAKFDRPKTERRFPGFAGLPWGCSQRDIDWRSFGIRSGALDYVLAHGAGVFTDEHRADIDCIAVLHVLAHQTTDADPIACTYLSHLLRTVRKPTMRIEVNPPRGFNEEFKARRYRAKYVDGKFQCWQREVQPEEVRAEEDWMVRECRVDPDTIVLARVTARERYSGR